MRYNFALCKLTVIAGASAQWLLTAWGAVEIVGKPYS
jgi:hypothetical protein